MVSLGGRQRFFSGGTSGVRFDYSITTPLQHIHHHPTPENFEFSRARAIEILRWNAIDLATCIFPSHKKKIFSGHDVGRTTYDSLIGKSHWKHASLNEKSQISQQTIR
jgi:hypothetical protein